MLEFRFSHSYEAEMVPKQVPSTSESIRFSAPSYVRQTGIQELCIEVTSTHGCSWRGIFEGVTPFPDAVTGLFATPDPDCLFVVARGQGYLVPTSDPDKYTLVEEILPILYAFDFPRLRKIVLGDFIHFAAYDPSQAMDPIWISDRLASDGFTDVEVDKTGFIRGGAWSAQDDAFVPFELDPDNGRHTGGADELLPG